MSDRVAVFNKGRIEQVASPRELYARPRTVFVAGFVGTANILEGALAARLTGSERPLALRPEHIRLGPMGAAEESSADELSVTGVVTDVQFHGPVSRVSVEAADAVFVLSVAADRASAVPECGREVRLLWRREHMVELEA